MSEQITVAECYTRLQAELEAAKADAAALREALKRMSQIVSKHYGEDETEDTDDLNACFDVLSNTTAGADLLARLHKAEAANKALVEAAKPIVELLCAWKTYCETDDTEYKTIFEWLAGQRFPELEIPKWHKLAAAVKAMEDGNG